MANPTSNAQGGTGGGGHGGAGVNQAAGAGKAGVGVNPNPASPAASPPNRTAPINPAANPLALNANGFTQEQQELLDQQAAAAKFLKELADRATAEVALLDDLTVKVEARAAAAKKYEAVAGSFGKKVLAAALFGALLFALIFTPEGRTFAFDRLLSFKNTLEEVTGTIKVGYSGRPEVREITVKRGEIVKVSVAPGVRYKAVLIGQVYAQTQDWLPHSVRGHEDLGACDFLAFSGDGVVKITTGT